jgi:3-methyladenine DNA glycosylase AlkD
MATKKPGKKTEAGPAEPAVSEVVAALQKRASKKTKDGMARYGIPSANAFGVPVGAIKQLAKSLGKSHALAEALWKTGYYEARMLATFVDEHELVTSEQMDRWCRDFDNWAICDTACFALFDRTPHAFKKVAAWAKSQDELVKRAAFALLWGLTVHDQAAPAAAFLRCLPLVERAALDERHFVKKSVNMALRAVGKRSLELNRAALGVAERLAARPELPARWIGKDALRELKSAAVQKRLKTRVLNKVRSRKARAG